MKMSFFVFQTTAALRKIISLREYCFHLFKNQAFLKLLPGPVRSRERAFPWDIPAKNGFILSAEVCHNAVCG